MYMSCMKSVRSKLASTHMAEEARILACILAHASRAKHKSLGSMCIDHPSQSIRLEGDAMMPTASKDVTREVTQSALAQELASVHERSTPLQMRRVVPSTSASHHLNSGLRAEQMCRLACCLRVATCAARQASGHVETTSSVAAARRSRRRSSS